jgi:Sulfotransferase family/Glycosyl transferase family 2
MRVVAILAAYNEEHFVAACLDHLIEQGVEAYLIDNCSTDRTVEIAERYLGRGLIDIETFPRNEGIYKWEAILRRKEELAASLDADWFMHADPDEIRLPPRSDRSLAQAFAEIDEQGYNAVNFLEFTFVPTREAPDHDHPHFWQTMRWYYPFQRHFPVRVNAWRSQPGRVALARSGGHRVQFPDLRLYPESFKMRHYLFLSVPHALRKYAGKKYDAVELQRGWHDWRARVVEEKVKLPSQSELHSYVSDDELNLSNPRTRHVIEEWSLPQKDGTEPNGRTVSVQRSTPLLRQAPPNVSGSTDKATTLMPVCIGGMHRSGTSMVTKLLHQSGLYLGQEHDLMPPASENPEGFWENLRFVEINEEILNEFGGEWDCPPSMPEGWDGVKGVPRQREKAKALLQEFSGHEPWGWKDPRNSLTLPFWMALVPDVKLVVCLRNPLEVALSLRRRNGVSYAFGLTLWQAYYQRILETTSAKDRILTHYDAYFHDPREALRRIFDFLDVAVSDEDIDSCLSAASIGPRYKRFTIQSLLDAGVSPVMVDLYGRMCEEAGWIDGGELYRGSKADDSPSEIGRRLHQWNGGVGQTLSVEQRREGASEKRENIMPEASGMSVGGVGRLDTSVVEAELLRQERQAHRSEGAEGRSQLHRLSMDWNNENLKERYEARIQQHKKRYRALMADYKKLEARSANLEQQLHSLENHLHSIEHSRAWRLFDLYRRLRTKLASSSK